MIPTGEIVDKDGNCPTDWTIEPVILTWPTTKEDWLELWKDILEELNKYKTVEYKWPNSLDLEKAIGDMIKEYGYHKNFSA